MKRHSPTNSDPWTDLDYREEYRWSHPVDEIACLFPEYSRCEVVVPWPQRIIISRDNECTTEIHHLAGGLSGNRRWDRCWNLVALSHWTHYFVNYWRFDGIVLCLTAKLAKGEFDWCEARETLGMDLRGHLECKRPKWDFVKTLHAALLRERGAA